jgi:hypothetical protein
MKLEAAGSVLLVGAGKMGTAMAAGWLKAGLPGAALTLVDPAPHDSVVEFAAKSGAALRRDLPSDPPGVIVLAVKPQVMDAVLAAARHVVGPDTLVLSIAAGISIDRFRQGLGTGRIVRTMPNTPAQLGKGITGAVAADGVTGEDRKLAGALLAAAGEVVWLDACGKGASGRRLAPLSKHCTVPSPSMLNSTKFGCLSSRTETANQQILHPMGVKHRQDPTRVEAHTVSWRAARIAHAQR